jgi:hypothetical protein
MAKNETNLKATEEFIRNVLAKNFNQDVHVEDLRTAAARLCDAMPEREQEAA